METRTSWRKATLYTSSFTGHASASTNMWRVSIISGFHLCERRAYLVAYWPVSAPKCSRAKALAAVAVLNFRSEEHTSELQSLMRISYAVFCLKKKNIITTTTYKYCRTIQLHTD